MWDSEGNTLLLNDLFEFSCICENYKIQGYTTVVRITNPKSTSFYSENLQVLKVHLLS